MSKRKKTLWVEDRKDPDWKRALNLLWYYYNEGVTTAEGQESLKIVDWRRRLTEVREFLFNHSFHGRRFIIDWNWEDNEKKAGKHKRYFLVPAVRGEYGKDKTEK